jgi:nucleoside-diphosphate-sugar epimerase
VVLLIGGKGLLGSALLNSSVILKDTDNLILGRGDVSLIDWKKNPFSHKIELVIYLAASTIPSRDVTNEVILNTKLLLEEFYIILDWSIRAKVPFVFISSSGSLSLRREIIPWRENDLPSLSSYYSQIKVLQEGLLISNLAKENLIIMRPSNLFGFEKIKKGFGLVDNLKFLKKTGNAINIFSNINCYRDYIYVEDFVYVFDKIIKSQYRGVVNVASGHIYTILELIEAANVKFHLVDGYDNLEPYHSVIDNGIMRQLISSYLFKDPINYLVRV